MTGPCGDATKATAKTDSKRRTAVSVFMSSPFHDSEIRGETACLSFLTGEDGAAEDAAGHLAGVGLELHRHSSTGTRELLGDGIYVLVELSRAIVVELHGGNFPAVHQDSELAAVSIAAPEFHAQLLRLIGQDLHVPG